MSNRIVFPGDPEYDEPNPTRDWHNVILFVSIIVMFFSFVVAAVSHTPWLTLASILTFLITFFTTPFDPRYP